MKYVSVFCLFFIDQCRMVFSNALRYRPPSSGLRSRDISPASSGMEGESLQPPACHGWSWTWWGSANLLQMGSQVWKAARRRRNSQRNWHVRPGTHRVLCGWASSVCFLDGAHSLLPFMPPTHFINSPKCKSHWGFFGVVYSIGWFHNWATKSNFCDQNHIIPGERKKFTLRLPKFHCFFKENSNLAAFFGEDQNCWIHCLKLSTILEFYPSLAARVAALEVAS